MKRQSNWESAGCNGTGRRQGTSGKGVERVVAFAQSEYHPVVITREIVTLRWCIWIDRDLRDTIVVLGLVAVNWAESHCDLVGDGQNPLNVIHGCSCESNYDVLRHGERLGE